MKTITSSGPRRRALSALILIPTKPYWFDTIVPVGSELRLKSTGTHSGFGVDVGAGVAVGRGVAVAVGVGVGLVHSPR